MTKVKLLVDTQENSNLIQYKMWQPTIKEENTLLSLTYMGEDMDKINKPNLFQTKPLKSCL